MSDPPPTPAATRISLRGLLALVAIAAAGCTALKFANPWWIAGVAAVALLAFMAQVIVALVDRGPRQAFAIGFAICTAIYGIALVGTRWVIPDRGVTSPMNREMDPYQGALPTTWLLRPLFEAVVEAWYLDPATGNRLAINEQNSQRNLSYFEEPRRAAFMPIGHLLWTLILGAAGGLFARYVYARRT